MDDLDRLTEDHLVAWCENVVDRMDGIAEWTVTLTSRGPLVDGEHPHYAAITFHHLHPDARTIQLHGCVNLIAPEEPKTTRVDTPNFPNQVHYSWELSNGWRVVRVVDL